MKRNYKKTAELFLEHWDEYPENTKQELYKELKKLGYWRQQK